MEGTRCEWEQIPYNSAVFILPKAFRADLRRAKPYGIYR